MKGVPNWRLLQLQGITRRHPQDSETVQGDRHPNQIPRWHRQRSTDALENQVLLRMVRYSPFHSSPLSWVELNHQIGRQISVRTINRRFFNCWVFFSQARQMPWTNKRASSTLSAVGTGDTPFGSCFTVGTLSPLTSLASNYIVVMVGFKFEAWRGDIYQCLCAKTDSKVLPSIMVWGTFHFRVKSELVIAEAPCTSKFTDWCSGKMSCPRQGHLSQ